MKSDHVLDMLAPYAAGVLDSHETRRVGEHLLACAACRAAYEEAKRGALALEALAPATAPEGLWEEIVSAVDASPRTSHGPSRPWAGWLAAAAAVVAAVAIGLVWSVERASGPSWQVTALGGAPRVAAEPLASDGTIHEGETLETDGVSRAEIRVGLIGFVDVEPNSRVRLVNASLDEHRLALDRGQLHAQIWAPPRLFFVDTPSAVAVDYGCAYTLTVDDDGRGLLHVTSGWVSLERDGRESLVPAGGLCETRPEVGPGTPFREEASGALREALTKYDFEGGGEAALATVLAETREGDTLTLWFLFERAAGDTRARIYDRLASFAPPPEGVTRELALAGDRTALDRWLTLLEGSW